MCPEKTTEALSHTAIMSVVLILSTDRSTYNSNSKGVNLCSLPTPPHPHPNPVFNVFQCVIIYPFFSTTQFLRFLVQGLTLLVNRSMYICIV
jgi:hypothetical protein